MYVHIMYLYIYILAFGIWWSICSWRPKLFPSSSLLPTQVDNLTAVDTPKTGSGYPSGVDPNELRYNWLLAPLAEEVYKFQIFLLICQLTVTSINWLYIHHGKIEGNLKSTWKCELVFWMYGAIPGRRWLEIRSATSLSFLRGVSRFRHLGETDSDCLQESRKCAVCPRSVWKLGASGPKVVSEEAHVEHPL